MQKNQDRHVYNEALGRETRPPRELCELLFATISNFNKDRIAHLLKSQGVDHVGNKDVLLDRLNRGLVWKQTIDFASVESLALELELFSQRHTYLVKQDNLEEMDSSNLASLIEKKYLHLIGRKRRFELPAKLGVDSIQIEKDELVIYLSNRETIEVRQEHQDEYRPEQRQRARIFQEFDVRKVYVFRFNVLRGEGSLSIPSLKSPAYAREYNQVIALLKKVVPLLNVDKCQMQMAIDPLRKANHVTTRGLNVAYSTFKASFRSYEKRPLVSAHTPRTLEQLIDKGHSEEGLFSFHTEKNNLEICSGRIYKDGRIGIFQDLDKELYEHVIEVVREHAR